MVVYTNFPGLTNINFNVFRKTAHNCEIEMQTFSGQIAVIQLSEALSFRHLFISSRDGNALIHMCTL